MHHNRKLNASSCPLSLSKGTLAALWAESGELSTTWVEPLGDK